MNWFTKLFQSKPLSQSDRDYFDACAAFTTGKRIWEDAAKIKGEGWRERRLAKIKEALKCFDEAIEKGFKKGVDESETFSGFDESEAFSLRGSCLNDLEFYFEALEDYNKAIEKKPRKGIANNYHMRSMIKDSLCDFEGSLADLREAIRLSKLDNEDNAYWNSYAKSTGFASQTAFYEMFLPTEDEIYCKQRAYSNEEIVADRLKTIKRRESIN